MSWVHTVETDRGPMDVVPLTSTRLPDMAAVFGVRGTARRCFCMHWRRPDGGFGDDRDNRDRFADVVDAGRSPGLLGYVDSVPLGWVQVGPRGDFPTIARSPLVRPVDGGDETWSVNCFVIRTGHRRRRVASGLLAAAVAYAREEGARRVEGYPVDGERSSAVDLFTGTLSMFTRQGFVEVIRRNPSRPVVRLEV
jgi:GNAT superfamily N-acetyltransferase